MKEIGSQRREDRAYPSCREAGEDVDRIMRKNT
jgi:hypothetical protein